MTKYGGGWLFDAEPRQPAGIPRKQRRAAGCENMKKMVIE